MAERIESDREKDGSDEVSEEVDCPKYTELDVHKWSSQDVCSWLQDQGFNEEAVMFQAQGISGKALISMEKSDLKELGIKTLGRRLEIFQQITSLTEEKKTDSVKPEVTRQVWKKKITKDDRANWKPQDKANYLEKISLLNREAALIWPGNVKIHLKGNASNRLKVEELVTRMVPICSIPEIGFGRDAVRNHLLQWFHEKNRRIEDGYDYEASHTPAKRAKLKSSSPSPSSGSLSDSTMSVASSSSHTDLDEDDEDPSDNVDDISRRSAEICIMQLFNVVSVHYLTVKKHLLPLGKALSVKCRSLGKYEVIIPLAKALFKGGHINVKAGSDINYRDLKRSQVTVVTNIDSLLSSGQQSGEDSSHSADVTNPSQE